MLSQMAHSSEWKQHSICLVRSQCLPWGRAGHRLRRLPLTPGSKAEPQYQPQVHSWACIGGTSCPLLESSQAWDIEYVHPGNWACAGAAQYTFRQVLSFHYCPDRWGLALVRARSKSAALLLTKLGTARAGYLSLKMSSCSWHSVKRRWNRRFCPMTGNSSFSSSLFRRPCRHKNNSWGRCQGIQTWYLSWIGRDSIADKLRKLKGGIRWVCMRKGWQEETWWHRQQERPGSVPTYPTFVDSSH